MQHKCLQEECYLSLPPSWPQVHSFWVPLHPRAHMFFFPLVSGLVTFVCVCWECFDLSCLCACGRNRRRWEGDDGQDRPTDSSAEGRADTGMETSHTFDTLPHTHTCELTASFPSVFCCACQWWWSHRIAATKAPIVSQSVSLAGRQAASQYARQSSGQPVTRRPANY